MEEKSTQTSPIQVIPGSAKPSNGKGKKLFISLLALILLAGASFLAYLWSQEKSKNSNLNSQISGLNNQINSLKNDLENSKKSQDAKKPEDTSQTTYKAEVGKFSLSLPSDYVIIKNLDAGFEGGPATILTIGKKTSLNGVVDSLVGDEAKLEANPNFQSFEDFVTNKNSDFEGGVKNQPNVSVDGVSARSFKLSGLIDMKALAFEKNKISYYIRVVDSAEGQKTLDAIVAGFKFN